MTEKFVISGIGVLFHGGNASLYFHSMGVCSCRCKFLFPDFQYPSDPDLSGLNR